MFKLDGMIDIFSSAPPMLLRLGYKKERAYLQISPYLG
jgi:hypothetical protein